MSTKRKPQTTTYKLETIGQAVEIGTTLSRNWFRGHARVCGELTPSVFREEFEQRWKVRNLENDFYHNFIRLAPARASHLPNEDDVIAWLFLMQHHGTPTRLLDWSGSVLVGLYFAVQAFPDEDGELWSMYAQTLNLLSGYAGHPTPNNPHLRFLARECTGGDRVLLAKTLGLSDVPARPLAVLPPLEFPRLVTQSSVFTIHPRPVAGYTIPDLLDDHRNLVRYIIPARYKTQLRKDLNALGINHSRLFPDLDALSVYLRQDARVLAYTPPEPPQSAGLWRST